MNGVVLGIDRCDCGWLLPLSVIPVRIGDRPADETAARGYFCALVCPRCNKGHVFAHEVDDLPAVTASAAGLGVVS